MTIRDDEPKLTNQEPLFTRAFILLVVGHFLQALGWSSMLLLPVYLGELKATNTDIGTIMASASIGGLILRPVVGWALDNVGRKPTLIAGTVILGLGMGSIVFVDTIDATIYLARILIGIGAGALFTGYFVFVTDFIPANRRTEGIALFGISGLLPVALNSIVERFSTDYGVGPSDLRYLFPALAACVLSSIIAIVLVPEHKRILSKNTSDGQRQSVMRAIMSPGLQPVWLATVIFASLVAVFMAFVTVTAHGRGIEYPAQLWAAYASGAVGVRLIGAKLPDRVGPANLLVPAIASYATACLISAEASTSSGFLWAGLLAGFGHGYCFPVLTGQVVTRSSDQYRGSAMALFTALWEISALILTPIYGLLADLLDQASMFGILVLSTVCLLILWVPWEHRAQSVHRRKNSGDEKRA